MRTAPEPRVDRLLSFLPLFEQRGYSYGEWRSPPGQFPYFAANDEVSRFVQVLYEDGWVKPFDWSKWQPRAEALYRNPKALARARISTLRRLLTLHVRKNRFCEGHLAGMLAEGHMLAILRRIAELHAA
jgi:uncharacterized protein DUF6508